MRYKKILCAGFWVLFCFQGFSATVPNLSKSSIPVVRDPFIPVAENAQGEEVGLLISALIPLRYAKAADLVHFLQDKNTGVMSANGRVSFYEKNNSVWLQDDAFHLKKIKKLIEKLDVPVKQVSIKARIVNIDVGHERQLGVRFGLTQSTALQPLSGAQALSFNAPSMDNLSGSSGVGLSIAKLGNGVLLDMELSAMEQKNVLDIVATPRLIASNRQSALIESGSEIPYQEQTSEGATSAVFKKAVMQLKVTPEITPENKIKLLLEVRQDKPGVVVSGIQTIDTQHMKTSVLLENGETVVVGGIREKEHQVVHEQVPFLGSIPLLGRLFQHEETKDEQKELIIFITPTVLVSGAVS